MDTLQATEKLKPVQSFVTEQGSVYTYLEDGTTQRFQKATDTLHEPQDAIVFVPDYGTLAVILGDKTNRVIGGKRSSI